MYEICKEILYFISRLIRYLYPTDDELRCLAGLIKEKQKGKKDRKYHENGLSASTTFHVPRNLDFEVSYHSSMYLIYKYYSYLFFKLMSFML